MAEVLAAVGVAASIIQLVDAASKITKRVREFQSELDEVPQSLTHLCAQLPLLNGGLNHIRNKVSTSHVDDALALGLVVEQCKKQILELDTLLVKITPTEADNRAKKLKKALDSVFRQDEKISRIVDTIQRYVTTLTFYQTSANSTLKAETDTELRKVRKWLGAPDSSTNHHQALTLRQNGTGQWLLRDPRYAEWKISPNSICWLFGIAGCGKTVLSSTILEDLTQATSKDAGQALAYFYFDFKDGSKQSPEGMIKSLISQLTHQVSSFPSGLLDLFHACQDGASQPTFNDLLPILHNMCDMLPHVFIVLDALDECEDRGKVTALLRNFHEKNLTSVHLLLTARKQQDIEGPLRSFMSEDQLIPIQNELVDEDIRAYVEQRLATERTLKKWHENPVTKDKIESSIAQGAKGMFRWAACQMDSLLTCRTRKDVTAALSDLPKDLNQTYDRILESIPPEDSLRAVRLLRWLAFASRSLTPAELSEVVALDVDKFDEDDVLEDPSEVLDICSSLVTTTAERELGVCVHLAHYSVKEYLLLSVATDERIAIYAIEARLCHQFIARCSIRYLLRFSSYDRECYEFRPYHRISLSETGRCRYPLLEYASEFWIEHGLDCDETTGMLEQCMTDLFYSHHALVNWSTMVYKLDSYNHPAYRFIDDINRYARTGSVANFPTLILKITVAARYNLTSIARSLLDGVDVMDLLNKLARPVYTAAREGHYEMVKLLMGTGANVNANAENLDPLIPAIRRGHNEIAKLLIDAGADVHGTIITPTRETPLYIAAEEGNCEMAKLLVDAGADINTTACGKTPLYTATRQGHYKMVQLLLKLGASIETMSDGGTALIGAFKYEKDDIRDLLIRHGADVNATSRDGNYSCLYWAIGRQEFENFMSIFDLCFDQPKTTNVSNLYISGTGKFHQNWPYGAVFSVERVGLSMMIALARSQYGPNAGGPDAVRELLTRGIDPRAGHEMALRYAAFKGHPECLAILVDACLQKDAAWRPSLLLFEAACRSEDERACEILIRAGADITGQMGQKVLSRAWYWQNFECIFLLSKHGASYPASGSSLKLHPLLKKAPRDLIKPLIDTGFKLDSCLAACISVRLKLIGAELSYSETVYRQEAMVEVSIQELQDTLTKTKGVIELSQDFKLRALLRAREIDDTEALQIFSNAGWEDTVEGHESSRATTEAQVTAGAS